MNENILLIPMETVILICIFAYFHQEEPTLSNYVFNFALVCFIAFVIIKNQ